MKILGTILARGGSKRIHKKNIRLFNGRPIIFQAIDKLNELDHLSKIHISTEDDEIIKIVEEYGYKTEFKRPSELASDESGSIETINYIINKYNKLGENYTHILNLPATSVFTTNKHLKEGIEKSIEHPDKVIISVKEYNIPIENSYVLSNNLNLIPYNKNSYLSRTQEFNRGVYDAGLFAIIPTKYIIDWPTNKLSYEENLMAYLVNDFCLDIDNESDWEISEKYIKSMNLNN